MPGVSNLGQRVTRGGPSGTTPRGGFHTLKAGRGQLAPNEAGLATPDRSCKKRAIASPARQSAPEAPPPVAQASKLRRGAGVVDRGGLENRCARKRTVGSNPTLSAIYLVQDLDLE
jgi:hypothetical protein